MTQNKNDVEEFQEFAEALKESTYLQGKPLAVRKAAYADLVDKVEAINYAAAQYMKGDAMKLDSFIFDGKLFKVFNWRDTPQGAEFWLAISDKLMMQETNA